MTAEPTNRSPPSLIAESAGAVPMGGKRGLHALLAAQSFWVTIVLVVICGVMSYREPGSFATEDNFFNITRNFAFIGVMALGMTPVSYAAPVHLAAAKTRIKATPSRNAGSDSARKPQLSKTLRNSTLSSKRSIGSSKRRDCV